VPKLETGSDFRHDFLEGYPRQTPGGLIEQCDQFNAEKYNHHDFDTEGILKKQ
jgi:hypothetical protein